MKTLDQLYEERDALQTEVWKLDQDLARFRNPGIPAGLRQEYERKSNQLEVLKGKIRELEAL